MPQWGASTEYPQHMFFMENLRKLSKKYQKLLLNKSSEWCKIQHFLWIYCIHQTLGPSCSKPHYLNELLSGQNANCSSKYNIYFKCKSCSHFFSKNISVPAVFNGQSYIDTLTNNIISFEQLGPDFGFCLESSVMNSGRLVYSKYWYSDRQAWINSVYLDQML